MKIIPCRFSDLMLLVLIMLTSLTQLRSWKLVSQRILTIGVSFQKLKPAATPLLFFRQTVNPLPF